MNFSDVEPKLSSQTLAAVAEFHFTKMTPVQAATIPLFLKNKDVCVEATTGSGKTLAFGIPVFELLTRNDLKFKLHEIGALIIAPTRELASQIYDVFQKFSTHHHTSLNCSLFVGGSDIKDDINSFTQNGSVIVIGTPGRVLDIHKRCPLFKFNKIEVLILDEADTLLDMGFKESINQILSLLPKQRRTGLFSATQTKELKDLVRAGMRNPVSISVKVSYDANADNKTKLQQMNSSSQSAVPITLSNFYSICSYENRPAALVKFITQHVDCKFIVFCATCACVDYYSAIFNNFRRDSLYFPSSLLITGFHGKMVQKKRNALYKKFVFAEKGGIMFSTDVAARGIDIPDVDWIIQLAAPKDPAFFVHRVGRTARAGKKGGALLFVTKQEQAYVNLLQGRGVPLHLMNIDGIIESDSSNSNHSNTNDDGRDGSIAMDVTMEAGVGKAEEAVVQLQLQQLAYVSQEDGHEGQTHDEGDDDDEDGDDSVNGNDDDDDDNIEYTAHESSSPPTSHSSSSSSSTLSFSQNVLTAMKKLAMNDRSILEAGSTAFMSFLRAYQEHLCSYIFKFDQLDIGSVARSYALLRLPKIPETRGIKGKNIQFETSDVDTSKIRYKHKEREAARIRKLEVLKQAKLQEQLQLQQQQDGVGNNTNNVDNNGNTITTTTSSSSSSKWIPAEEYQRPEDEKRVRLKKRSKQQILAEEWEELAAETSSFKKFKKGKLSTQDYDKMLMSNDIPNNNNIANISDNNKVMNDDDDAADNDNDNNNDDDDDDYTSHNHTTQNTSSSSSSNIIKKVPHIKKPIDEQTAKIIDFWSQKTIKTTKQNKKRSSTSKPSNINDSTSGNNGKSNNNNNNRNNNRTSSSSSSSAVSGSSSSSASKRMRENSSNSSNNSNIPSFFEKRKKFQSLDTITDSLSSKNKQKINNKMMIKPGKGGKGNNKSSPGSSGVSGIAAAAAGGGGRGSGSSGGRGRGGGGRGGGKRK